MAKASIELITATIKAISEKLEVAYWNKYQDVLPSPVGNTGSAFEKISTFKIRAYDWSYFNNEVPSGDYKPNFTWRDFEVEWYKYIGRGMETNMDINCDTIGEMLIDCYKAIDNWENAND